MLLLIAKLALLWIAAPISVLAWLRRAGIHHASGFALAFCISPALIAWTAALLLRVFPHQSPWLYLAMMAALLLSGCFIHAQGRDYFRSWKSFIHHFRWWQLMVCGAFIALVVAYALVMPMTANDPLEYFYLGHLIAERTALDFYPSLSALDARGFIAPWTHPAGFATLIAWAELGAQTVEGVLTAKLMVLSFLLGLALLLSVILWAERRAHHTWLAFVLFITTPICLANSVNLHIDNARMLFFLLPLYLLYLHLQHRAPLWLAGLTAGMGWFFHSSGALTLLMVLGLYVLAVLYRDLPRQRHQWVQLAQSMGWVLLAGLAPVIWDLAHNMQVFSRAVGDRQNIAIMGLFAEEYDRYLGLSRHVGTLAESIGFGIGRIFIEIRLFGIIYWALLLSLVALVRPLLLRLKQRQFDLLVFASATVVLFFLGVLFATCIGIDIFVVNPRYLLQIIPFVCLLTALGIGDLSDRYLDLRARLILIALLVLPLALYSALRLNVYLQYNYFPNQLQLRRADSEKIRNASRLGPLLDYFYAKKGLALVHRQADLIQYSDLNLLHVYDQRFAEMYDKPAKLKKLDYVVLNYYNDPAMMLPQVQRLLMDPTQSTLDFDSDGWKVFNLHQASHAPYASFHMQTYHSEDGQSRFFYSRLNDYPSKQLVGRPELGEFPDLTPGVYDFIISADVTTDRDTEINSFILREGLGASIFTQQDISFYLKPGSNHIATRYVGSHLPFRMQFKASDRAVKFGPITIRYRKLRDLLSPANILIDPKTMKPAMMGVAVDNTLTMPPNTERKLLFKESFNRGDVIEFTISGWGLLSMDCNSHPMMGARYDFLSQLGLGRHNAQLYGVSEHPHTIRYTVPQDGYVGFTLRADDPSRDGMFHLSNVSIIPAAKAK
jgi:hypothetical protein